MNGLFLGRGQGKTTAMVYVSAITGYPIIVPGNAQKGYIMDVARRLRVDIPDPLIFSKDAQPLPYTHNNYVLVDNAEQILHQCIADKFGANIFGFTMTYDRKE